ncbi:MAG: DUF4268 domain-containing protein [Bacteroidales bacterium]|nr:DUF4268 domain-containing protein [Bacteroidales bacterium]
MKNGYWVQFINSIFVYSKEDQKQLSVSFWSTFGEVSKPFLRKNDKKKWMLYNTRVKGVELKFFVGRKHASVILEMNHRNEDVRLFTFELLHSYREILHCGLQSDLEWVLIEELPSGKEVSVAQVKMENVDFHRQDDWPFIFDFFMMNMLVLENNFLEISEPIRADVALFIAHL